MPLQFLAFERDSFLHGNHTVVGFTVHIKWQPYSLRDNRTGKWEPGHWKNLKKTWLKGLSGDLQENPWIK